jgi:hypothetical protein
MRICSQPDHTHQSPVRKSSSAPAKTQRETDARARAKHKTQGRRDCSSNRPPSRSPFLDRSHTRPLLTYHPPESPSPCAGDPHAHGRPTTIKEKAKLAPRASNAADARRRRRRRRRRRPSRPLSPLARRQRHARPYAALLRRSTSTSISTSISGTTTSYSSRPVSPTEEGTTPLLVPRPRRPPTTCRRRTNERETENDDETAAPRARPPKADRAASPTKFLGLVTLAYRRSTNAAGDGGRATSSHGSKRARRWKAAPTKKNTHAARNRRDEKQKGDLPGQSAWNHPNA